MTQICFILLAILLAYMCMCAWFIWYENKQPVGMPFSVFRAICGIGTKATISDLPPEMAGLPKIQLLDSNFRTWLVDVLDSGDVSRLQFFAFNQQRISEIEEELRHRDLKS